MSNSGPSSIENRSEGSMTASTQQGAESMPLLVMSTAPSLAVAEQLAKALLEQNLAACVSMVPGARSVYRWKGEVCTDEEVWLMIKTMPSRWMQLQALWPTIHPYDVPELIAVPVTHGLPAYVDWVFASTVSGGLS